jgi:hypothetical protein
MQRSLTALLVGFAAILSMAGATATECITTAHGEDLVAITAGDTGECEKKGIARSSAQAEGVPGPFGCNEEDVDALEKEGLKRFGIKPHFMDNRNFFGKRGILDDPILAQSGERLEMHWEGFFPRIRLYYFPSRGHRGVVIGECTFPEGCNDGFFFGPDTDNNGIPDSFRLIQWVSSDYGLDDKVRGYLDRYRYIYDVLRDRYYLWHDLLFYRCPPPVSIPPDVCTTSCDPPYETRTAGNKTYPRIFKTDLIEEKRLIMQD